MTDGYHSPNQELERPVDTKMPHSTSDVRDLADLMRQLSTAIGDAIDLSTARTTTPTTATGTTTGGDRFRASLQVGRDNIAKLEADVDNYARKLDEYANALSAADDSLERARDTAHKADLLDGTVIHPPETGTYIGERMASPDQREPGYDQRKAKEDAYHTARAEFDIAAKALAESDGIPQLAKDIVTQTYLSTNDFVKSEIAKVAN